MDIGKSPEKAVGFTANKRSAPDAKSVACVKKNPRSPNVCPEMLFDSIVRPPPSTMLSVKNSALVKSIFTPLFCFRFLSVSEFRKVICKFLLLSHYSTRNHESKERRLKDFIQNLQNFDFVITVNLSLMRK